ncbi:MAG: lysophospholipid acyltransferase family protein [Patescibacteria group bacterium]
MSYPISRRIFVPLLRPRIMSLSGLENVPKTGPAIYVANHVSEQDAILIAAAIIPYTHGKKIYSISKWKILSFPLWKKWLGTIPIYRDRGKTIDESMRLLRAGRSVLVFPEGGINTDNVIEKAKTGAARLSLSTTIPVIPIGLRRTSPPPKTPLGFFMEIFFGRLHITIGSPIDLKKWHDRPIDRTLLDEVNQIIMSRIAHLAGKHYQPEQS